MKSLKNLEQLNLSRKLLVHIYKKSVIAHTTSPDGYCEYG